VVRAPRTVAGVFVSILLRLLPEPLAHGRLVGRVEVVETGERTVVRSVDELVSLLRDRALEERTDPGEER